MKIAVSIPDELFEQAEVIAARHRLNRSQLYARALEAYLLAEAADPVSARLDELADEMTLAGGVGAGRRLIESGAWEW